MNGTNRKADLWFLEYSVFARTRFEHVYRCSPLMQSHHAKRLEKAHECLLRERQISVMLSSLRLWSSEAEIGWQWPMLVPSSYACFSSYCSQTMDICLLHIASLGWSHMLAKFNEGEVWLLPLLFPPSQVSGSSSEFRSPTNNHNSTTARLRFLCCKYLYVGALFWWEAISCNVVTVLVLGSFGTLAL